MFVLNPISCLCLRSIQTYTTRTNIKVSEEKIIIATLNKCCAFIIVSFTLCFNKCTSTLCADSLSSNCILLKARRYSPNFIIFPIFGPSKGSLWPIWKTRSQWKRETSLEERSGGGVFAVFLLDRFVQTCDLFSSLVATLATQLFPATNKYHYCSESYGVFTMRISNRRDFLTCWSSSTCPSNFLATPSLPRLTMRTQTLSVKVVYGKKTNWELWSEAIEKPSFWSLETLDCVNPIQGRLFWSSGGQGGGGGGAQSAPLVKTLFPFSESTQVKFFWKLVQNWVLWSKLGFHGNHGYGFKVVHSFRFLTRNHHSKIKNLVPLNKSKKVTFFWKLMKTKSNDTIGVAMVVVVFILRSMKHEKESETVTRTPSSGILSPNLHNRFHLGHPS